MRYVFLRDKVDIRKLTDELELSLGVKLRAETTTDTVEGSVTVANVDASGTCIVIVETYDDDRAPETSRVGRKSTLKRCILTREKQDTLARVLQEHQQ
jgi:hypothetical protein